MTTKYRRAQLDRDRARQARRDLERELRETKAQLARAMRVVEAAKVWAHCEDRSLNKGAYLLWKAVEEWEDGR